MNANIFPCKHCGYRIGSCSEAELKIADVSFFEKVSMRCPQCRRMNRWVPAFKIDLQKTERRVTSSAV